MTDADLRSRGGSQETTGPDASRADACERLEDASAIGAPARGLRQLAAGTLASRLLGFARDLLTAALLGPAADAFLLAFRLPNVFRRLLAEGSLGLAFGALSARGGREEDASVRLIPVRAFFWGCLGALALGLAAGPLVLLLAPGLNGDRAADAALYLRCCLVYLPFCLYSALALAACAGRGRLRPQASAPALFNAVMLLAVLAGLLLCAGNPHPASLLLCAGVAAGGLAQALFARRCLNRAHAEGLFGAAGARGEERPSFAARLRGGAARALAARPPSARAADAFLLRLPALAAGAAPHQAHVLAALIPASLAGPGCISALYFAERLIELPLGLAGAVPGLAALPRLAACAGNGDGAAFSRILRGGIRFTFFLSLPAAAGLFALARPLADLLFGHGAFGPQAVDLTAIALRGYAFALPVLCAARPLLSAVNALGAGEGTLRCGLWGLAPLLGVSLAGRVLAGSGEGAAFAVGLGLSAGALCSLVLLMRLFRRAAAAALPSMPCPFRPLLPLVCGYGGAACLLGGLLACAGRDVGAGPLCLLVAGSALAWVLLFRLCGNEDARLLVGLARRGGERGPSGRRTRSPRG